MRLRKNIRPKRRAGRTLFGAAIGVPLLAALGGIGYSNLFVPHDLPLSPAVAGERRELVGRAGRLSYYVAGSGAPLLLVHSINAAASSYEVRPAFEQYRASRRVYALDLPGFGFSDRSPRAYMPRLYTDAILDLLDVIERDAGPAPVDALALSLGSEFVARAATERPKRFRTLALVTPTGLRHGDRFYRPPGSVRGTPSVRAFFEFPLWSRPFFDLLNSRVSQRYFLKQTFGSYEAVDRGLLDYDYLTAHQPDAQHAPYAFISALLFSADINRIYESLDMPVWLAYGTRGEFSNIDAGRAKSLSSWVVQPFDAGAMPYFEQPEQFFAGYDDFLQRATHQSADDNMTR